MGKITVSGKGRRWLERGHPWAYVDDIANGKGEAGELVPVETPNAELIGWGLFSTTSRIAVRMVTREAEQPNRAFWLARIKRAVDARHVAGLMDPEGACRLLSGDAEGVPGLIVDRYADVLVLQCGTQSADRMRDFLIEILVEVLGEQPRAIVDRSDIGVRRLEGLEPRVETISGTVPDSITVREGAIHYTVDVFQGHKTGAYLDQRNNRIGVAKYVRGGRVLDAFSYDGLFGLQAAVAGAESVLCLEQNKAACERLMANAERNGVADKVKVERVDAMSRLRSLSEEEGRFRLAIVDPPAFARNRKEVQGAERGYVEVNRRGLSLLEPSGTLVSASCSYNIQSEAFLKFLQSASRLARRDVWLDELTGASPDHPYSIQLPESRYLKCAFMRAD
ncbi:MAG: 23S rRNA (cytosine1962-C5)-methyltransferase [Chlamydiales bacterium]|jgi:23S rRNA (cytosine1962-C5)-methyltransferase